MAGKTKKVALGPGVCDGCGKCVEACLKAVRGKRDGGKQAALKLLRHGMTYVPVICRNCEDAPCVTACMSGCRQRNGKGWVITDYRRCVGCWMCIMNCPFGAIGREPGSHIAPKCEGCLDREIPACVAACGRGILTHRDVRDLSDAMRRKAAARFLAGERETPAE
ncbi:MAG: 4Fe-4S binding protein [Nitrospirae bacterium]|nr:4Fe-4S binding protein [Nitrospirota bacterium]